MVTPLILPVTTIPNARDLGSYEGIDKRKIKTNRLFRTGKLVNMDQKDGDYLLNCGLDKIIDLRTPEERKFEPDKVPGNVEHFDIPIHEDEKVGVPDEKKSKLRQMYDKDQYAGFKMMCHQYALSITSTHSQKAYNQVLEVLANNRDGATIFHCSEGKDRTGLATVYLLHILGVNLDVIRADYLYSNYMLTGYRNWLDKKVVQDGGNDILRASMRSLASVANEYLDTALILMNKEYGGLDEYLRESIGVNQDMIDELRHLYLEEA